MTLAFVALILGALVVVLAAVAIGLVASRRYLLMLVRLHEAIGEEQDPAELTRQLLTAVCKIAGATAGLLYGQEEGITGLRLKSITGLDQTRLGEAAIDPGLRSHLTESISGEGAAVTSGTCTTCTGFLAGYSAHLTVALRIGKKLVGTIVLLRSTGSFSSDHVKAMERFAPRAAVAFENARLYQQNKNAAEENARLYLNLSRLYRQATVDSLTGLHNRSYMQQRLKEEIKKAWRFRHPLSVVLIDLDQFQRVNEAHGHKIGDEILKDMADMIKKTARDYDVVCRYAGEEILVILPQTEQAGAQALAERLRREITGHEFANSVKLTCSFGVAGMSPVQSASWNPRETEPLLNHTADGLLALVGQALLQAKEAGGDRMASAVVLDPAVAATEEE